MSSFENFKFRESIVFFGCGTQKGLSVIKTF